MPRTFELVRHRDLSGVSGTGVVAEGCVFTDGSVALRWRGNNPATAVWPDLDSVLAVHGHHGATEVHWLEGWTEPATPELNTRPPLGERGARPVEELHTPAPRLSERGTRPLEDFHNPVPRVGADALDDFRGPETSSLPRLAGLDYPTADEDERSALDELFGVQHAVRPPSAPAEPGGHARGWSGARHLR
ncbi:hypothetical protein [Kribbella sp. NPDC051770]|uniref:hypothetical protein n=1 Tax=Kribbella sp. NPDC051770 TaxID=3155413 RepID=UPI0034332F37